MHAGAAACSYCHQTLDPLRSIFSASYSWNYHNQIEPSLVAQKGMFSFQGVIAPVSDMADMSKTLAQHPLFPEAWAQKLCYYVNSSSCACGRSRVSARRRGFQELELLVEYVW